MKLMNKTVVELFVFSIPNLTYFYKIELFKRTLNRSIIDYNFLWRISFLEWILWKAFFCWLNNSKSVSRLLHTISLRTPLSCLQFQIRQSSPEIHLLLFPGLSRIHFFMIWISELSMVFPRYVRIMGKSYHNFIWNATHEMKKN